MLQRKQTTASSSPEWYMLDRDYRMVEKEVVNAVLVCPDLCVGCGDRVVR